ncbi:hypothetical protein E2320_012583 [Naja naja]|nr:hypothetical protein E2320_012583 [Naja naja]
MEMLPGVGFERPFHIETPLLESVALSQTAGTKVYMKLENAQPSGSFKIRGIGYFCQQMAKMGCQHLICSSAYAARELRMPATIIVPRGTTESTIKRLEQYGASVWDDANDRAMEGHSSIVKELKRSLGTRPGAVVLSVGGGGLLAGVVSGLQEVGWSDVPIIAVETRGAESFNAAIQAGQLVTLPDITSVARCLGAKTVAQRALDCTNECPIISHVLEDVEAVKAVEQFLDDERILVDPACGASLALLYSGDLQKLQKEGRLSETVDSIVIIVCGGSGISLQGLQATKKHLGMK